MLDATRRGTKTIVVDPRPTRAARQAGLWLRVRPGTDGALALGLLHEMIRNKWYDEPFVADWTEGFPALAERAAQYPPARVAEITWIDQRDIEKAARMFGTARTAALYTFIGATMGGNAVSTLRLMGFPPALKGVETDGSNRFLLPPNMRMARYYRYDKASEDVPQRATHRRHLSADRFPLLDGPTALTAPYPHPRQVIDAMLTGEPFPDRALWTDCNPLVSVEDSKTVLAALERLDLLVVSDIVMSPTAYLADYVLPVTTHLESDAVTEYSGLNMVAARVRAIEPVGEAREEGEVLLDVLTRMGYGDKLPVRTYQELLDYRLEPMGLSFERPKELGHVVTSDSSHKHLTGALRRDGRPGFNTPSGKVELTSRTLAAHGYDPLPDFAEPPMSPFSTPELAAAYPLILISGTRSLEYYSTLGTEIDKLRRRRPFPTIEVAPETARSLGLEEGSWALVESPSTPYGIRRKVALLEGMHLQVVNAEGLWYMPGEESLVEAVLSVGANVLTQLRDDVDPIIGGSTARCILCRLTPAEAPGSPASRASRADVRGLCHDGSLTEPAWPSNGRLAEHSEADEVDDDLEVGHLGGDREGIDGRLDGGQAGRATVPLVGVLGDEDAEVQGGDRRHADRRHARAERRRRTGPSSATGRPEAPRCRGPTGEQARRDDRVLSSRSVRSPICAIAHAAACGSPGRHGGRAELDARCM